MRRSLLLATAILTTHAFAALHLMGGARSPTTLINMFLGGLLFGYLAAYGRGIAGAVGAHFAWNATEQLLLEHTVDLADEVGETALIGFTAATGTALSKQDIYSWTVDGSGA